MADGTGKIDAELSFNVKGLQSLQKADKSLESMGKTLDKVNESMEKQAKIIDQLAQAVVDLGKTYASLPNDPKTNSIVKRNRALALKNNSKTRLLHEENSEVVLKEADAKILKERAALKRALNTNSDLELKRQRVANQTKNASTREKEQVTAQNRVDLAKYRTENPDYKSIKNSGKYKASAVIRGIDDAAYATTTVGGRVTGDITQIVSGFLINPAIGVAAALNKVGNAFSDLTTSAINAYGSIEKLKVQMSVIYGSEAESESAFTGIKNYAVKSPFGIEDTAEMATLLKQSGVYSSEVLDTMKMIGDVASGNNEKMKRIANNYAQIEATGRATMLDMRQFAYAGIPIYREVAKEMGVSQQTLRNMIRDGKVTNDIIEKVFKNMTSAGGTFYGAVEKGSQTIAARKVNLEDIKQLAMAEVGDMFINFGDYGNRGGLYRNFIELSESFYKGLERWFSGRNLDRRLQGIEENKNQQQVFKELITYAEATGQKELVASLTKELKELQNAATPDKNRVIYEQSYQRNRTRLDYYMNLDSYKEQLDFFQNEYISLMSKINNMSTIQFEEDLQKKQELINSYKIMIDKLSSEIKKAKGVSDFSPEETIAHAETIALNARSFASGNYEKIINSKDSATSILEMYVQAEANTKEAIGKERQKTIDTMRANQNLVRTILEEADLTEKTADKLNLASLSYSTFWSAYNKGLITIGEQLDVVKDNYDGIKKTEQEWITNVNELKQNAVDIGKLLSGFDFGGSETGLSVYKGYNQLIKDLSTSRTPDEVYYKIDSFLKDETEVIDKALTTVPKGEKETLVKLKQLIALITQKDFGVLTDILKYNPNMLSDGLNIEPLWKRIIASNTKLDVKKFSSSKEAMVAYEQFNQRDLAKSILSNYVKSDGIEKVIAKRIVPSLGNRITNTVTYNGQPVPSATGSSIQLNYTSIVDSAFNNIKNGTASQSLAEAITTGLKGQLENIQQLAIAGFTTGEDADKSDTHQEMLKNAFGGIVGSKVRASIEGSAKEIEITWDSAKKSFVDANTGAKIAQENIKNIGTVFESMYQYLVKKEKELKKNIAETEQYTDILKYRGNYKNELYEINSRKGFSDFSLKNNDLYYKVADSYSLNSTKASRQSVTDASLKRTFDEFASRMKKIWEGTNNGQNITTDAQRIVKDLKEGFITFDEAIDKLSATDSLLSNVNQLEIRANSLKIEASNKAQQEELAGIQAGLKSGLNYENVRSPWDTVSQNFTGRRKIYDKLNPEGRRYSRGEEWASSTYFGGANLTYENRKGYLKGVYSKVQELPDFEREKLARETENAVGKETAADLMSGDEQTLNKALEKLDSSNVKELSELLMNIAAGANDINSAFEVMGIISRQVAVNFGSQAISSSFEKMGANLAKGKDAADGLAGNLREIGKQALANLGAQFVSAGLSVIATGGMAGLPVGLTLIAAGGMASLISGLMTEDDNSAISKAEDEKKRLEDIKDQLADLLSQAREDAIYYENNLRHKKAISSNEKISKTTSVNDAIITPNGNVITTHPDDYLIATKTPAETLGRGQSGSSPVINMKVINESGTPMQIQQSQSNNDNGVDFVAIIKSVAKDVISSPEGDDAFDARQSRLAGRAVVM